MTLLVHAPHLDIFGVWLGWRGSTSELIDAFCLAGDGLERRYNNACDSSIHGRIGRVGPHSIPESAPTCPDCLRLYQEALVMRDEHLMQWGEKE